MLIVSVVLYLVASIGLVILALKYLFGPAPTDYHSEILKRAGVQVDPALARVTGALNQVLGSALLAFAVLVSALALFGVGARLFWANAALLIAVLILGGLATRVAYGLEQQTGVRTPWRPAAALTGIAVVAFVVAAF